MATIDETVGSTSLPAVDGAKSFTVQNYVDFDATSRDSGDVIQMLSIPAGTFVDVVVAEIETVEGGTLTFDVGDGADANGWHDAVDGNVLGQTRGTGQYSSTTDGGKLYTTADTIDITLDNDMDAVKLAIHARCTPFIIKIPSVQQ